MLQKASIREVECPCGQPVLTSGEAVAGFEILQQYVTSFPVDDASM
jgi:hypothetical protein